MPRAKRSRRGLDRFLASHASETPTLDIGCGRAPHRHLFPRAVGVDLHRGKHIDLLGDAAALPIASRSFDQVLMAEMLEHVLDPRATLAEARRVLRPGGRLILTVPFIYPIHDAPHDHRRWTHHGLRHLLTRAGFEVEQMQSDHGTLATVSLLLHRVALQCTRSAWDPRRWVIEGLSRLVQMCSLMPLVEFGDTKSRHREDAILSMRNLVIARRPMGTRDE